jgi:hypothetical protein
MVTHRDAEEKHCNFRVNIHYNNLLNMARRQVHDIYLLFSDGDRVIVDYYYRLLPTAKNKVRLAKEQLDKGAGPYELVVGEYLNAAIRRLLSTNEANRILGKDKNALAHPKHNRISSSPWFAPPLKEMGDVNKSDKPEESR